MVNIDDFKHLVPRENCEIVRWDMLQLQGARPIITKHYDSIKSLIELADNLTSSDFRTLERYLCDGRKLANMIGLFKSSAEDSEEAFISISRKIDAELQQSNCYDEPAWVLWKRYLQDAFDVLMLWEQAVSEHRLPMIFSRFK